MTGLVWRRVATEEETFGRNRWRGQETTPEQDQQSWHDLVEYTARHSDAKFSHGVCLECLEKYYPKDGGNDEFSAPDTV